jgi:hypothetical protein
VALSTFQSPKPTCGIAYPLLSLIVGEAMTAEGIYKTQEVFAEAAGKAFFKVVEEAGHVQRLKKWTVKCKTGLEASSCQ